MGQIWSIGHSTHSLGKFIETLQGHSIHQLVDIRTLPRSRHNPQFNCDALANTLPEVNINYRHIPGLGGLRRARPDSVNTGWRNASFRGYADYMETPEFQRSLDELIPLATGARTAIMCAEAVQWRCHRSLVADALCVRGIPVEHIQSATESQTHKLTSFAHADGIGIVYGNQRQLIGRDSTKY